MLAGGATWTNAAGVMGSTDIAGVKNLVEDGFCIQLRLGFDHFGFSDCMPGPKRRQCLVAALSRFLVHWRPVVLIQCLQQRGT